MQLTIEDLKAAKFRGPVAFYDGVNGWARQDFECVDNPRFGYFWMRENYKDPGRQAYTVDGLEVKDLEQATQLLSKDPDPNSPAEIQKRARDEFEASPKLNYGATRALSEARCNADAGPFGMTRAWLQRSRHSWHRGLNAYSDDERKNDRPFPHWLYRIKEAAYEAHRGMYLFQMDRKQDIDLRCALGKQCRECLILKKIESEMLLDRDNKVFPREVPDYDIDAAKVWTCIGHILQDCKLVIDGQFFWHKDD